MKKLDKGERMLLKGVLYFFGVVGVWSGGMWFGIWNAGSLTAPSWFGIGCSLLGMVLLTWMMAVGE